MKRKKILIPFTVNFSVRYILRTGLLEKIGRYADLAVLLGWEDNTLELELKNLGVETYKLPEKFLGISYHRVRQYLDFLHIDNNGSVSADIDWRRQMQLMTPDLRQRYKLKRFAYQLMKKRSLFNNYIVKKEGELFEMDTNYLEYLDLIREISPDMIISLTPYFREEEFLLRAASYQNIPMLCSMLSFDNITTRGWIPVTFDKYLLWNQYNQDELIRIYPKVNEEDIIIVGVPQFDFYYDDEFMLSEFEWRKELSLPADRPVILFSSASSVIAPPEFQWVQQIDEAIDNGGIVGKPILLFRPHPNESISKMKDMLSVTKHVFSDIPWKQGDVKIGKTNISKFDISRLAATLKYCEVHVNASSTMTIDGAIFNRPQIGPAYDDSSSGSYDQMMKDVYQREHYLPITNSTGLTLAYSKEELIDLINDGFMNPAKWEGGLQEIVKKICTYDDGNSTERVNQSIKLFLEDGVGLREN